MPPFNVDINEQTADRHVGFHVSGMQLITSIADDSSMVGRVVTDPGSLVPVGDVPALSAAMAAALDCPPRAAPAAALEPFTREAAVDNYLRLIEGAR